MEELKPCPFCGSNDELDIVNEPGTNNWWVVCDKQECQFDGPYKNSQQEAIVAWNSRKGAE